MYKLIMCIILVLTTVGCINTNNTIGDNKPVAPDEISNECGQNDEPSLPYMKPWWKD